jgi:putative thioredoxin
MADSPYIFETTAADFDDLVLKKSRDVAVLVDFWAAWCAPCRALMPVLQRLVESYAGAVVVAKVNTDVEHELARRYEVRSLPTLMVFRNGAVAAQTLGAQPESTLRRLLDPHIVRASDRTQSAAEALYAGGRQDEAIETLRSAVQAEPKNDRPRIKLAEWLLAGSDLPAARRALDGLGPEGKSSREYRMLDARLALAESSSPEDPTELRRRLEHDPADHEARHALAMHLAADMRYEEAMQELLEIVRRNRNFGDDLARKSLLRIFDVLGPGELATRYRGKLASALN